MGKPYKVLVCGLKGIGKTTLLEQLIYNNLGCQDIHPTIEDIYVASVETDRGSREILRCYDTEGVALTDGADISIPKAYFSIVEAFVLVYATDNNQSFLAVEALKKDIDRNREKREVTVVAVSLNGSPDEKRPRQVDPLYVSGWAAREKVKHFDCSIQNRQSLFPPFVYIASRLSLAPVKTTFAPLGIHRKPKDSVTTTKQ